MHWSVIILRPLPEVPDIQVVPPPGDQLCHSPWGRECLPSLQSAQSRGIRAVSSPFTEMCVDPTRLVPAQGFGLPSPLSHPPPPPALGSSTVAGGGRWGLLPPFLSLNPSISSTLPVKSGERKPAILERLSSPSLWGQRQAGSRLSLPVPLSLSLFLAAGPRVSRLRPQAPVSWSAQAAITNTIEWAA